jgi:MSHA biogenesis protein MshP
MLTAIFLLVVISALGGYILTLFTSQQNAETLDIQGARAYQAAYTGIQAGVYDALVNGSCTGSTSIALAESFAVTVECTAFPAYSEGAATHTMYRIRATGCNPPNAGACPGLAGNYYVERQLEAVVDR